VRVFGGNPALNGGSGDADGGLRRDYRTGFADLFAFRDPDLRLDDIDACYLFGNRVFNLDSRVDLDKIE